MGAPLNAQVLTTLIPAADIFENVSAMSWSVFTVNYTLDRQTNGVVSATYKHATNRRWFL